MSSSWLVLHCSGYACYENTVANIEGFSPPPIRLVTDDRARPSVKEPDTSLSLQVKDTLRSDKPVDHGFSENTPVYSFCTSFKSMFVVHTRGGAG